LMCLVDVAFLCLFLANHLPPPSTSGSPTLSLASIQSIPTHTMKVATAILAVTAVMPLSALAGMYGDPVINLDAKSFKKAMATEHAAVCP
jgi:hypothetical protein